MKALGIFLLLLAGAGFIGAINVIKNNPDPGLASFLGAFAIPGLLCWWGVIAIGKANKAKASNDSK